MASLAGSTTAPIPSVLLATPPPRPPPSPDQLSITEPALSPINTAAYLVAIPIVRDQSPTTMVPLDRDITTTLLELLQIALEIIMPPLPLLMAPLLQPHMVPKVLLTNLPLKPLAGLPPPTGGILMLRMPPPRTVCMPRDCKTPPIPKPSPISMALEMTVLPTAPMSLSPTV